MGLVKRGSSSAFGSFTESKQELIGVGLPDLVQGPVFDLENHKPTSSP